MAGQLVPQSSGTGNAAFAQQGTVDWTALSRSSFTFSVEVMSRFSKAGVEMITCAMGQAMCSQFNVPPEGQKRVTDAISRLKAYSSYGQVLWFGFGVKHIVRSLCETKQGATCAALCACLRVSYSTEMSARVLSVLCDRLLPSNGLSPALAQWGALIDVCSGALSPSKFPVLVDGFCRLAFTDCPPHLQFQKATTADALAHALVELSKVSNGSVSSITFEGGNDCGWIASVAEWLLCLKVKVLTEKGSCLYWQDSNEPAQVIIIFQRNTHGSDPAETKELRAVNRSFRLPCNGVHLISRADDDYGELFGMGRSSWSTILEDTFGSAFTTLLSPNIIEHFAVIARRSTGLIQEQRFDTWEETHPWMGPSSSPAASRERAFFLAVVSRLPELSPLLYALEQLEIPAGTSEKAPLDGGYLLKCCACDHCTLQHQNGADGNPLLPNNVCLWVLGKTLMTLIWLLARINVDETIQPSSTGFLMLYDYVRRQKNDLYHKSYFDVCKDTGWNNDLDATYQRIFELFTGLSSHKSLRKPGNASAICHGGICIWSPALENPFYDPHRHMGLRVVPGKVSFRDRLYKEIVDAGVAETSNVFASIMPGIAARGASRISSLVIRETLDASYLEAWIELRCGETSNALNGYLDHLGVERPQHFPSELRLQIRDLYGNLHHSIYHSTCEVNLERTRSPDLPKPDLTTWERPCPSLTLTLESNAPPSRSYNYPEAGEWVVVVEDRIDEVTTVRLFRGDFSLLYYLMSNRYSGSDTYLSCFDGCLRCLAYSFAMKTTSGYRGCQIEIHTITENQCTHWSAKMTGVWPENTRATCKSRQTCTLGEGRT